MIDTFPDAAITTQRKYIPRPYQTQAIDFLSQRKKALLYDAPGLGKTICASEAAVTPVLVACPSYLTFQWYTFLREQYPEQRISLAEGPRAAREQALARKADWYILNTEMLRAKISGTQYTYHNGTESRSSNRQFGYNIPLDINTLIIDEAHHVRGRDSQQAKGAEIVARISPRVYLLTATPIYKAPDDLYQLLRLLDPNTFNSYYKFIKAYCQVWNSPFGMRVIGASHSGRLRKVLETYGLGRSYKDVQAQLPDLIRNSIVVRPDDAWMKRYKEIKSKFIYNDRDVNSLMEAMHIMRRITAECKLESMIELLHDDPEAIIFTKYRSTAAALASLLEVPLVDGDLKPSERRAIAQGCKTVVATIDSMSEGVDLSHLSHCVFFESDYVPAKIYQALSRVRRMRVDPAPVRVTYLYTKGTIDQVIHELLDRRNATIKDVMRRALLDE